MEISQKAFKIALIVATIFSITQLISGHSSAEGVAKNQPAKLAAMEGHYLTNAPADLYLIGCKTRRSNWIKNKGRTVIFI